MLYSLPPNSACLCVSYEIPRSQVPHCTDCTGTMTADAWLRDSNLFSDVLSLVLKTWINRDVENILSQNFKPFSSHVLEIYILIKCTSEQACYLSLILIRWKQKLLMSLITWNGHMYACMQWCLLTSYSSWGQRLENHQFPTWFDLWKKILPTECMGNGNDVISLRMATTLPSIEWGPHQNFDHWPQLGHISGWLQYVRFMAAS